VAGPLSACTAIDTIAIGEFPSADPTRPLRLIGVSRINVTGAAVTSQMSVYNPASQWQALTAGQGGGGFPGRQTVILFLPNLRDGDNSSFAAYGGPLTLQCARCFSVGFLRLNTTAPGAFNASAPGNSSSVDPVLPLPGGLFATQSDLASVLFLNVRVASTFVPVALILA
jgi:hypothetical protein